MHDGKWRERLALAMAARGLKKREVSLAAGLGAGYVHSVLSDGKEPTIDRFLKVCDVIGVSLTHIIYGFDVSAEDEEFLKLLASAPVQERAAMLALLRSRNGDTD